MIVDENSKATENSEVGSILATTKGKSITDQIGVEFRVMESTRL